MSEEATSVLCICANCHDSRDLSWLPEEQLHVRTYHQKEERVPQSFRIAIPYGELAKRLEHVIKGILGLIQEGNKEDFIEVIENEGKEESL